MAWTVPRTASTDEIWASSDWNTYVKNNLSETMPGKVSAALQYCVATGLNAITTRTAGSATVATSQTTTSTSYVDLTTVGPSVTATTGTAALVMWSAQMSNSGANNQCRTSVAVSSATTISANDEWSALVDGVPASDINRFGGFKLYTTLTAGSNIFTVKYRVSAGTGTFVDRHIIVVPL
jgi:hypothetical protein